MSESRDYEQWQYDVPGVSKRLRTVRDDDHDGAPQQLVAGQHLFTFVR